MNLRAALFGLNTPRQSNGAPLLTPPAPCHRLRCPARCGVVPQLTSTPGRAYFCLPTVSHPGWLLTSDRPGERSSGHGDCFHARTFRGHIADLARSTNIISYYNTSHSVCGLPSGLQQSREYLPVRLLCISLHVPHFTPCTGLDLCLLTRL